ncbi:MAG: hypothetical protein AB1650_08245 [Candidatus Omnitrophota bacterium]
MPFYQYFCEANGLIVEVNHSMSTRLKTWGEVCQCSSIDPGKTPTDSPVIRLISKPMPIVWRLKGLDKDEPSNKLLV